MPTTLIENLKYYIPLTKDQIEDITACGEVMKYNRKAIVAKQGDSFTKVCFVQKGLLKSFTTDGNEVQHVIGFSYENYWLSDIYSYVTGQPSTVTIEALEDCELVCFERSSMEALYSKHRILETHFRRLLEKRAARLLQDRFNLISFNAEERYLDFLNKHEELCQRVLQKDIASYLGIFPESLSRIRKNLAKPNKK